MNFADQLRDIKKDNPNELRLNGYINAVRFMCNRVKLHELESSCITAAKAGSTQVQFQFATDCLYGDKEEDAVRGGRPEFSVKLNGTNITTEAMYGTQEKVTEIVLNRFGTVANKLGLNLVSVICKEIGNRGDFSILVKFNWASQNLGSNKTKSLNNYSLKKKMLPKHSIFYYIGIAILIYFLLMFIYSVSLLI